MKFLLFFTRPPRRKANFQHFLAFSRGWRTIFHENWWFTPVSEQFFLKIGNLLSYLNSFSWKSSIYYRIWTVFSKNRQFTIVPEQIFLKIDDLLSYLNRFFWKIDDLLSYLNRFFWKIDDLLSYLNRFFWKLMIYYRIWTAFSENWWFTPVSEWFFLKIDDLLPYLSGFSWKLIISSRIWVIFLKLRRGSTAHPELEH